MVCVETVRMLWGALSPCGSITHTPPPLKLVDLDESIHAAAMDLVERTDVRDVAHVAYVVGDFYTRMLPMRQRADTGAHHTPPAIARRLLDDALETGVDIGTARILDPAAGAGAFLVQAARRIATLLEGSDPAAVVEAVQTRIAGWEIDPFAAWLANTFVEMTIADKVIASGRRLGPIVQVCDSLNQEGHANHDLVITNPPFGRVKLDSVRRAKFARSLYGHANLYGLFTDLSLRLAADGGTIALVMPTSFTGGQYFSRLRAIIAQDAPPISIDVFDTRSGVFEGVLQETALTILHKRENTGRRIAVGALHKDAHGEPQRMEVATTFLPTTSGTPWLLPRCQNDANLVETMARMTGRLADWGYAVKTGPLVWNRHKHQLGREAHRGAVPVVWAESVRPDGRFDLRCEKRNHLPYISPAADEAWLMTSQPCVLLQRTTAKEQSRRLIAALLPFEIVEAHPGGVVVENHVNIVAPTVATPSLSLEEVTAFLNTSAADRAFRCISGSVAVSAYEIEAMPLPSPEAMMGFRQAVATHDAARADTEVRLLYKLNV